MSKLREDSFINKCIKGEVLLDEIDDFVDLWHETHDDVEIHDFLGMTQQEYSIWVEDPDKLSFIVMAHRDKKSTTKVLEEIKYLL